MGSGKHVEGDRGDHSIEGWKQERGGKRREKLLPGAEGGCAPRCKAMDLHPQILSKNYPETVYFIRFI